MLDNFLFSLNVVVPVFLIMILGYELKRRDIITSGFLAGGNKIVFYIALPALLFRGVYTSDIRAAVDIKFVAFAFACTVFSFFALWGISAIFIKDRPVHASFTQGAFRGSFALFGIPLLLNMAGDGVMARAALLVVFIIPFFNVFSVMVLAPCAAQKPGVLSVIWTVIKNPSNVMISIGILLAIFDLTLPVMVSTAVNTTANMATPLALLCLGGGMTFRGFDTKFKYALTAGLIKIFLVPLVFTALAVLFGFRDYDLAVLMIFFAVPSAVVGYSMAAQMGGDTYVAGTIIVIATLGSAFTLTLFIYSLRALGLLVV